RQYANEPFGELDRRLVRGAGEDHVLEPLRLFRERMVQPRIRMPVDVDPPGRDAVEEGAAVFGVEIHPLAADDRQRRHRRLHLRVRMPDHRTVAVDERHVSSSGSARPRSNSRSTHDLRHSLVSGENTGISPSTGTPPYCSMANRLSGFAGPTMTTPFTVSAR